jgi:hypothetical protein
MTTSGSVKTTKRVFDLESEGERIKSALDNLRRMHKPGELTGKGTKMQAIETQRAEIELLVKDGYSVKQIAQAMSNDVFGILPKSITQLLNKRSVGKATGVKRTPVATATKTTVGRGTSLATVAQEQSKKPVTGAQKSKQVTEIGDIE